MTEHIYEAIVYREDGWWMVSIPELDGLTHTRNRANAELMAREYIAVNLDVDIETVRVNVGGDA